MIGTKARIINHETQLNNKIVYVIEIQDTINHQFRITKLRYSQVREIHEQIQKLINKLKLHIYLPQLPRRKLFGSTNNNENLIESRKKDLDKYLSQLLSCEKLHSLDIVKKYYIPFENDKRSSTSKQQINIQICIDRYTLIENVVIYYVRLRDLNSHQEWTFKTRYSQLRNVHDALNQSKIKNFFIDRPIFPKKKILGITNQSPQSIEKRRQELEKYFTQIFSLRQVMNSEAIKYFIEQSKSQAKQQKQIQALRKKKTQLN